MPAPPRQLVIALVLLALTLAGVASGVARAAWNRVAGLWEPVQRGLAATLEPPPEETAAMRELVVRLGAENQLLRHRLEEYQGIKREAGISPQQVVVARGMVIGRTQRQGRRFCELDIGAVDGVERGMAAVIGWSLVGLVSGVQEGRCLVQLASDSESRIPAAIYNEKQELLAEGVLAGTGRADGLRLDLVEDRTGVEITRGMGVAAAGVNDLLPPRLVLGRVSAVSRSAAVDHWTIEVEPLRSAEVADSLLILRASSPAP